MGAIPSPLCFLFRNQNPPCSDGDSCLYVPGIVRTAITESSEMLKWSATIRDAFEEGRERPPEDAANLVLKLASGQADALSGRHISVREDIEAMIANLDEID